MNDEDTDDIDYENLDDLPLLDHIEWNHSLAADEIVAADLDPMDWQDS